MKPFFNVEAYYSHLKTTHLGRPCIYLETVDSTIDVAAREAPNSIVIARTQLKGRGQRTNVWQSPPGCAMGSIRMVCRKIAPLGSRLCFLQHIMVLVAANTLEQIDSLRLGKRNIRLKWPNDIIYSSTDNKSELKIGGVLVQTREQDDEFDITLSFGLNVFNSEPTTCIKDILGFSREISIESIVADMMNQLERYTYELDDEKFEQLKMDYTRRCIQMNKLIEDENNGQVRVRAVNDDGYLIGERCTDGKLCTITKIINQSPRFVTRAN